MTLGGDGVGPPADLQGEAHRQPDVHELVDPPSERGTPSAGGSARVPDFYIAGHAKSGTTALYFMLRSHPQIHMPVKEPRFFAPELRTRFWRPESSKRMRPRTLEGYRALFADAAPAQRIGEATPSYLRSSTAAERIAAVEPGARIIAILREPASFLRSFHLQSLRNLDETEKDFRKAMALEEARRQGRRIPRLSQAPSGLLYSEHVRYVEQLRRYHAVFPREQVLVLIYDDFRADNDGTVRRVLRFLELDDTVQIPKIEFDSLRTPRFQALDQLSRAISITRRHSAPLDAVSRSLEALTPERLRRSDALGSLRRRIRYTETPPPDEELMLELRRRFKPEVEAVSDYLGRDLVTLWGYDRLR